MPAFRISGGLLLFLMAVDMLFERRSERREKQAAVDRARPVGVPAGHAADRRARRARHHDPAVEPALRRPRARSSTLHLVLVAVLALTWLVFRGGGLIERALGQTGVVVITRLLGILLAALAVQFVLDGLRDAGLVGS